MEEDKEEEEERCLKNTFVSREQYFSKLSVSGGFND